MRFIDDYITAISSTSEDAAWPFADCLNDFQKEYGKAAAGVQTITISLDISKGDGIYIGNTNANIGTVTVKDSGGTPIPGEIYTVTFQYETYRGYLTQDKSLTFNAAYQEFAEQSGAFKIDIELSTTESEVFVGVIRSGIAEKFKNPVKGVNQKPLDFSIRGRHAGGQKYYKELDQVRVFSGSFYAKEDDHFIEFRNFCQKIRSIPVACNIFDNQTSGLIFGTITYKSASRVHWELESMAFEIEETI
jgi:hypothetical protein